MTRPAPVARLSVRLASAAQAASRPVPGSVAPEPRPMLARNQPRYRVLLYPSRSWAGSSMVEQQTLNLLVEGSSPSRLTKTVHGTPPRLSLRGFSVVA